MISSFCAFSFTDSRSGRLKAFIILVVAKGAMGVLVFCRNSSLLFTRRRRFVLGVKFSYWTWSYRATTIVLMYLLVWLLISVVKAIFFFGTKLFFFIWIWREMVFWL